MTDQMADCEKSFYRELYHYAGDDKSIVMDTISGRICFKKILDVYNVDVFEYLMTHSDIHIPKIRAFWKEDERLVVIEELISGDTLEYILCNNHPTDERRKDYLAQICDGLSFLHRASRFDERDPRTVGGKGHGSPGRRALELLDRAAENWHPPNRRIRVVVCECGRIDHVSVG